jgi:hypothetical protein
VSAPRLDIQLADVGSYVVWGQPGDTLSAEERQIDGSARDGVVWLVDTHVDPDSGEVSRLFRTVKQWRGTLRWDAIPADHVAIVHPMNSATVRALIRALGSDGLGKRGPFTSDHTRAVDALTRLIEAVVA